MSSASPSNVTPVVLVGGPRPQVLGCVVLPLRVGETEFYATVMPDRSILIPEWVPRPTRTAAAMFASQFERGHRIVIHQLLKGARESLRVGTESAEMPILAEQPSVSDANELIFRMVQGEGQLVLHISHQLNPCQFHVDEDAACNVSQLFAAYDAALDYMQEHLAHIEQIGFDTALLRLSMSDWERYRERFRLL